MIRLFKKIFYLDVEYDEHKNCLIYDSNNIVYEFFFPVCEKETKFGLCDEHIDVLLAHKINSYLFNNLKANGFITVRITTNLFNKKIEVNARLGFFGTTNIDITKFFHPSLFRKNINLDKFIKQFNKQTGLVKLYRLKNIRPINSI